MIEVTLPDGSIAEFPDGTSPEVIKKALSSQDIDRNTGASWGARFAIGSASDMQDKVARARAYYGDSARQEDGDNISFVDPKTGQRMLVNPEGFDLGDIAGSGREIIAGLASVPGTAAGAAFGALPGGIAGGAATGALGGQVADVLAAWMARSAAKERGNTVPGMQHPTDAGIEAGKDFGAGILGGAVLGAAGKGISAAVNPLKKEVVEAYRTLGQKIPSLSAAARNPGLAARVENTAGAMFGGGRISQAAQKAREQNFDSLSDIAQRVGGTTPPQTVQELGKLAVEAGKRGRANLSQFYEDGLKSIGGDAWGKNPAQVNNLRRTMEEILGDTTGNMREEVASQLRGPIQAVLNDADSGVLNYASLNAAKHRIWQMIKDRKDGIASSNISDANQRRLYGAVKQDIRSTITDPDILAKYDVLQNQYNRQKEVANFLEKTFRTETDTAENVGKALLNPTKMNGSMAEALRKYIPLEDFNRIRAGIIHLLGQPRGAQGIPGEAAAGDIMQALGGGRRAYSPEAQKLLFGSDLDPLRITAQAQLDAAKAYNTSNTANQLAILDQLKGLGRGVVAAAAGGGLGGIPGAVASVTLPNAVARLHTNPGVLEYLARPQAPWAKKLLEQIAPMVGTASGVMGAQ